MQVYLLADEADQNAADSLQDFLVRHGCHVRTAFGTNMSRPANPDEMTIGLWSLNTRMSQLTRAFTDRSIDALVNNRLAIGQLDEHPLPYGLSDMLPTDLRSPGMRNVRFQRMLGGLRKAKRAEQHAAIASIHEVSNVQKSDVFISYAHADREIVWPLVDDMQATSANIWIDKSETSKAYALVSDIDRAIRATHLVCVMGSSQSYASDQVRREIYLADKHGKTVLPVLLDGAIMPEDIGYFLNDRPSLDMTRVDFEKRPAALRQALTA